MIDTVVYRLHGINQQKTDTLTILQHNKDKIENFKKYQKDASLSDELRSHLKNEIQHLEDKNADIHNIDNSKILLVPEHFDLYSAIMEFKGKSFTRYDYYNQKKIQENGYSNEEFLSTNTSKKVNTHYLELEKLRLTSGDYVKSQTRKIRGNYRVPSSSSDVNFSVNPDGGYIDFNVSIPKYLYLHNVAQFIPQVDSKNKKFLKGNFDNWAIQRHYAHDRFISFTKQFFIDLYSFFKLDGILPNYDYLEIRRIDLCFNQHFKTKEDALLYLSHQKKLYKKSNLKYKDADKNFDTSISFHTAKHEYFKIYHKGTEYKSTKYGDFKKHEKINRLTVEAVMEIKKKEFLNNHEQGSFDKNYVFSLFDKEKSIIFKKFENDAKGEPFSIENLVNENTNKFQRNLIQDCFNEVRDIRPIDTKFLGDEADKILRYEISISGYSFNNMFKRNIFRYNDKTHNYYKGIYNNVKKLDSRKESYKYKITPEDRRDYQMMHDFYNRTSNFTLTSRHDVKYHQKKSNKDYSDVFQSYSIQKSYWLFGLGSVLESHDVFFFSDIFLKKLIDKFKEKIDYFQLKQIEPYDDLQNKVLKYNQLVKSKLEVYNKTNKFRIKNINGTLKIHKGKEVTKASQLLTESERRKKGFQRINLANISLFFNLMHNEKMSMFDIKKHLKMSTDAFYRRKRSLECLGIYENHLSLTKPFNIPINFREYYRLTTILKYKSKFFFHKKFSQNG